MRRRTQQSLLLIALLYLLTGCGTRRYIGQEHAGLHKQAFIQQYEAKGAALTQLDARGKIALFLPPPSAEEISVSMRWSYKAQELFVLSLRPLGLIEVGRLSVTPDRLVAIDRTGRRGSVIDNPGQTAGELLAPYGIDVQLLSALAAHQPFTPTRLGIEALKDMHYSLTERGEYRFSYNKGGNEISHLFDRQLNLIESIIAHRGKEVGRVSYGAFTLVQNGMRPYPTEITLESLSSEHPVKVVVTLMSFGDQISQQPDHSLPGGYTQLSLQEVINLLTKEVQ